MRVFLANVPVPCGGGNTESGDTALLWKSRGVDVTVLYFEKCRCGKETIIPGEKNAWVPDGKNPWVRRLEDSGVSFAPAESGRLDKVPGLAGSVVTGFCSSHLLHNWPEMSEIGCRVVWSPCMTYVGINENEAFRKVPPNVVHFQSVYQQATLEDEYRAFGCCSFRVVHGAFKPLDFNPRPAGERFVVGRLARPNRTKWTPHLWKVIGEARKECPGITALCQAWTDELSNHCGAPPDWAECLPINKLSSQEFLDRCHAMICPNWSVSENWPRVGLEAMSAGVPVIADSQGGWPEMLGGAGILADTLWDYVPAIERLSDRERREELISLGAKRVAEIANPDPIADEWLEMFRDLGA